MVCGTYLEENCPSTNRHLLGFGGVKKLARMVCGTYFTEGFLQEGFPETFILYKHLWGGHYIVAILS